MSNMSYCRFENTLIDLNECYQHMNNNDLIQSEKEARIKLIKICMDIADDFNHKRMLSQYE